MPPESSLILSPEQLLAQAPTAEGKAIIAATAMTALGRRIKSDFILLAQWAYIVRRDALWAAHAESWEVFVDALGIEVSPKRLTELASIWEILVVKEGLPSQTVAELGASKATYLLPSARRGALTPDLLAQAQDAPNVLEVQHLVGRKIPERELSKHKIACPNCGHTIWGARWDNAEPGAGNPPPPQGAAPSPPLSASPPPAPPGGGEITEERPEPKSSSVVSPPLRRTFPAHRATGTRDLLRAVEEMQGEGLAPVLAQVSPDLGDAFTPWEVEKRVDPSLPGGTIVLEYEAR